MGEKMSNRHIWCLVPCNGLTTCNNIQQYIKITNKTQQYATIDDAVLQIAQPAFDDSISKKTAFDKNELALLYFHVTIIEPMEVEQRAEDVHKN